MTTLELREIDYQMGGTTLNQYQRDAYGTAVYPGQGTQKGLEYTLFGLLGEVGELANKYKKILRSEINPFTQRELLMDEAMDGAWYLLAFLKELGYTFQEGAEFNLAKLAARKAANQLKEHK
jgi:NTP pyrophosphatase (non-canonical NTP hydrolase)